MVSKASELLPLPERPVTTTITSRGRETFTFFRLCSRAPRTTISCSAISSTPFSRIAPTKVYGPRLGGQGVITSVRFYHSPLVFSGSPFSAGSYVEAFKANGGRRISPTTRGGRDPNYLRPIALA